jgi:O-antigen/teichoic acid export membrane protein
LKIASNAVWMVGLRVSANLLNLLLFVAISRNFGPAGVGIYSYGFAIAGFVYVFTLLGIDEYGIREYTRLSTAEKPAFLARLLGAQCFMAGVAAVGLAAYLVITGATAETVAVTVSLGVYQLAYAFARTLFVPAIADQAMRGPAIAEFMCRGGAFVAAATVIIFADLSLAAACTIFTLFGTALVLMALRLARQHTPRVYIAAPRRSVKETFGVLWAFAAAEILGQLYTRISVIVLTLTAGAYAAGLLATGLKFVETACIPFVFLGIAAYPKLSQTSAFDPAGFARLVRKLWLVWVVAGGLLTWGFYFVAPQVIVPVLGPKFTDAVPVVVLMTALALFQVFEVILARLMLASDLQVTRFKILAVCTALSVVLNLTLAPKFGVPGAVAALTISTVVLVASFAWSLRRRLPSSDVRKGVALVLGSLIPAALIAWALAMAGEPAYVSGIASLIALLGACGLFVLFRVAPVPR